MSKPIKIEIPDEDVPRMVAALREHATRAHALALTCENIARDLESNDMNLAMSASNLRRTNESSSVTWLGDNQKPQ